MLPTPPAPLPVGFLRLLQPEYLRELEVTHGPLPVHIDDLKDAYVGPKVGPSTTAVRLEDGTALIDPMRLSKEYIRYERARL
jgi:hypothetical protein